MGVEVAANPQQQAIADALWDNVEKQARAQHDGRRIALTRACDVKVERPVFLHNPLVPTKVLTLIAGRAGVSKSTLSIDIAAKATLGKLTGDWQHQPVTVAFAAIEDDMGMQKARLQAAGADMNRVLFLTVDEGLPHRHTTRTTRRRTESTQMGVEVAANPQQQAIADALWDNVEKQARAQHDGRRIALTRACDVKVERPVFLHNPLVPTKVLTLIAGRAGVSKSTLSIDIAAKATLGKLTGDWQHQPVTVAFAAIEDDMGMQKARLQAAGADMNRVLFLTVDDTRDGSTVSTGLQLPDDTATLRDTLREHDVKLLVIDPITSCIDGNTDKRDDVRRSLDPLAATAQELGIADTLREHDVKLLVIDPITSCIDGNTDKRDDVRRSLDPLAATAQELGIAIIGILHFNKGGGYASDKVSGSHAFRDTVRSLILVAKDDETGECVVTLDKSSYTPQQGASYKYTLAPRFITDDNGERMEVPIIAGFTPTDTNVNEVINRNVTGGDTTGRTADNEVADWLTAYLAENGPTSFKQIAADAKDAEGYTSEQLRNARKRAREPLIVTVRDPEYKGKGQRRLWQLE